MEFVVEGLTFTVDDEFAEFVGAHRWKLKKKRSSAGKLYVYPRTYVANGKRSVELLLHRYVAGAATGQVVDHINGDTRDNRRENLRLCTQRENAVNRAAKVTSKTGAKGVYVKCGRVYAAVSHRGTTHYLGRFGSVAEAAAARDAFAQKLHGEFFRPATS